MKSMQNQKGWLDASLNSRQLKGQLRDEDYDKTLAIHDPIWRYIISHYPREIYGSNIFPLVVCGHNAVPLAIELSQWTYQITFLIENEDQFKKVKRDLEIHAGVFKEGIVFDFTRNIPHAAIVCFLGVLDSLENDTELFSYIDLLLRRTREIVCSVSTQKRDWLKLKDKYDITFKPYPDRPMALLAIRELV